MSDSMWGELHEMKAFNICLPCAVVAGEGNRKFRELGATLFYDVYGFEATQHEPWQSESFLYVNLKRQGREVDAQEDFDEIVLTYPFATRPSADQRMALEKIRAVAETFEAAISYNGEAFDMAVVLADWDRCTDFLLKEWGEEPGSKELRRMIEENVPSD